MQLDSKFAKRVFSIAGIYGIAVLLPQYFVELGAEYDGLDRPELHYGFTGVALVWQFAFLVIARDVQRYRPLMLVAILEKLAFGLPVAILYAQGKLPAAVLGAGAVDLGLGVLFWLAYRATGESGDSKD